MTASSKPSSATTNAALPSLLRGVVSVTQRLRNSRCFVSAIGVSRRERQGFLGRHSASTAHLSGRHDVSVMLWRAAPFENPYFGKGSYWTGSLDFAARFRVWLDVEFPERAPHVIYQAAYVDGSRCLTIPFGTPVDSPKITSMLSDFAAHGYLWVTFYERVYEGLITAQWVYLGDAPLVARPLEERL
jgi:hypothetical protein